MQQEMATLKNDHVQPTFNVCLGQVDQIRCEQSGSSSAVIADPLTNPNGT